MSIKCKKRIGAIYFICSLLLIIILVYKNNQNAKTIKLDFQLLYEQDNEQELDRFFTIYIHSVEGYVRTCERLGISASAVGFDVDNFDFENNILVMNSIHKINNFFYNTKSKEYTASKKYIAVPMYDRKETNKLFFYSISSEFVSADNSKAYIEEGEFFMY